MMWLWAAFFIAGSFCECGGGALILAWTALAAVVIPIHVIVTRLRLDGDRAAPFSMHCISGTTRAFIICSTGLLILSSVNLSRNIYDLERDRAAIAAAQRLQAKTHGVDPEEDRDSAVRYFSSWIVNPVRNYMEDSLRDGHLTPESVKVLRALILALQDKGDTEMMDTYAYLGIAHLLALSGSHLGVLAMTVSWVLSVFSMKKWQKDFLLLALMTIYTMVAGCPDSLLRALSLLASFTVISALSIRETLSGALAMAGLIVLSMEYRLLFSWGFQLSFIAVAGIAFVGIPLKKAAESCRFWSRMTGPVRFLAFTVIITVSVQIFMLPLVLEMFGRSPLLATVTNVIMTVPVTVAMILGFVYTILPFDLLKQLLSVPVNLVTHFMYYAPSSFMGLGGPGLYRGQVWYLPYLCGMVLFCWVLKNRNGNKRGKLILSAFLIMISFLQCVPASFKQKIPGLSMEGNHWKGIMLYDGNERVMVVEKGIGVYQARKVVRDFWAAGIGSIDYIVVLPTDADVVGGLPYIASRLGPHTTICSPYLCSDLEKMPEYDGSGFRRTEIRSSDCEICMGGYSIAVRQPVFPPLKGMIVSFKDSRPEVEIIPHN